MLVLFKNFLWQDEGVTAMEYALIAIGVAMAILIGAGLLGTNLGQTFSDLAPKVLY